MASTTSAPPPRPAPVADSAPAPARPTRTRRGPALAAAAALGGAGLVALGDPGGRHIPLCALHATTGLDCPFCGGLRAVQDLVRLDPVGAAGHNLLLVVTLPVVVTAWFVWWRRSRTPTRPALEVPRWVLPATLVLLALFGVVRNLPIDGLAGLDAR